VVVPESSQAAAPTAVAMPRKRIAVSGEVVFTVWVSGAVRRALRGEFRLF
jgi:hypothetical protein